MTVQAVLLKAVSVETHWFRAAETLGWSPRTLRRFLCESPRPFTL